MTFLRFMLFTAATVACARAEERKSTADKCAGTQGNIGQTCSPTACANRDKSCPLIPDVLCASDECGCQVAFFAVVNQTTGREKGMDVTDLCRAIAGIKAASDLMEGLLAGEVERRDLVASNPDVLFRVFSGLNMLSVSQLKWWILQLDVLYPHDRSAAMETRRHHLRSELAALEERMRKRKPEDVYNAVIRAGNMSNTSSKEEQKELHRRKDIIRRWTKKQERVQILDENVSMYTLMKSARTASRKYAVSYQGSIIGSQMPIYGNMLYGFSTVVGGRKINDEKVMLSDHGLDYRLAELLNQLIYLFLDEIIARNQLKRRNFLLVLPPVSALNSRIRFNFYSFAPLLSKREMDGHAVLRLMSLAAQTAALGMDLYNNIVGQSSTALVDFVLDWNVADDLTEFLF